MGKVFKFHETELQHSGTAQQKKVIILEEMLLKSVELGALGIFCLLLLTKGLNSLTALSDSQKALTQAIEKFTDKINSMDSRISNIARNVLELKQLVKLLFPKPDVIDKPSYLNNPSYNDLQQVNLSTQLADSKLHCLDCKFSAIHAKYFDFKKSPDQRRELFLCERGKNTCQAEKSCRFCICFLYKSILILSHINLLEAFRCEFKII